MQAKGLQKVEESQNPDLLLTASGGMKQQTSYTAWGMRGIGGGMGSITPEQKVGGNTHRRPVRRKGEVAGVARDWSRHA